MKKIIILTTALFNISPVFANNEFIFQDKPINPACVAMFNSSEADNPYIKSINLNVCQDSNAAYQTTLSDKDGSYYFYINDKDDTKGRYSYKLIGKTSNGIYVLNTYSSGGGTLNANDILLIKLKNSDYYTYNQKLQKNTTNITEMQLLGYITGGDRCTGSFTEIKIVGNQIQAKQYQGENASDCSKIKNVSIDLSDTSSH